MSKRDRRSGDLFIESSGQLRMLDKSAEQQAMEAGRVECLGQTFESDEARRAHFLERLREKLADPESRKTPGFPKASDDDILRLSDPPYYTACPNPFLDDFVRQCATPFDPAVPYHREPFAVDVSVGKTDALYKAHGYHTKVPHLAIVPSILHYTRPGDLVLDGFCGSGLTGVAAQWCGTAPTAYRKQLEQEWKRDGWAAPAWGARRVILGDLSPAATFIAAGYNLPFDVTAFAHAADCILKEVEKELGWMYETHHPKAKAKGRINFTVWSEVFSCPECSGEVVFVDEALDEATKRTRDAFPCPKCKKDLDKDSLERVFETLPDPATRKPWKRVRFKPVRIDYSFGKTTHEKKPDAADLATLERIAAMALPIEVPTNPFPLDQMYHGSRLGPKGFTHIHHLFLPRAAQTLGVLWRHASTEPDTRLRNALLFFVEQAIWGMSILNRYSPSHFSQVNRALNGVYYVASQHSEVSPWYILEGKADRLEKSFKKAVAYSTAAAITTGDCGRVVIPEHSVDYVFTDPPFGENIYYADLNFLVESWHRVLTDSAPEAIVDQAKKKGVSEYQDLMRRCFAEYYRVLKPGRWMTVVFSNSSNAIWRAIQEAMGTAGFVIADVRTLDKQQGSYRQVTSSAVKQDLVISAYKPTEALARGFTLGVAGAESAWVFIREHLANVPVFVGRAAEADVIGERTPQMLQDRMIAFHVQRGLAVPVSGPEFLAGLAQRFPERDGMHFLPEQVAEYDKRRAPVEKLKQVPLYVTGEASAILWVRFQLKDRPQSFQDLQPQFMREIQGWEKHERTIELRVILEQNFIYYDGTGPVPAPIHSYLSSNFKDMRNRAKDDAALVDRAHDRWYVPDPSRQGDVEKLREKALLREFEEYKTSKKLKQFRTEAVRVGFKKAYDERDYATIVSVAAKLPEEVLQQDEKLLMYYDVARMRLGQED
jgi:16S rRNA G966 N2-methylase RsmD